MENLPPDVLSSILSNLKPSELFLSSCVNKQWNDVAYMQSTWTKICPPEFCRYYLNRGDSESLTPEAFFRDVCQGLPLRERKEFLSVDRHSGSLTYFMSISLGMNIS